MSEVCTQCGLPKELCVCETIAKESQSIELTLIKKKFGKKYTVVTGIDNKEINLKDLTKKLKAKLACGGTVKGNVVELQGDHTAKVKAMLIDMGFAPETIRVKYGG
jgi:translation initiation factor 1